MTLVDLRALHAIVGDAIADIERVYSSYNRTYGLDDDAHNPYWRSPSPASSESSYYSTSTSFDSSRPSSPTFSPEFPITPLEPISPVQGSFPTLQIQLDSPFSPGGGSSRTLHSDFDERRLVDFPSLSGPYDPQSPSEKLTAHPDVASAVKKIVAACGQIGVMVQVPFLTLCDASMGYHLPSCLRFFEASHTVEILRDAGRKGMHVEDIAAKIGCDVGKLSHILRLLATHHLLTEVTADTFAINRVSSAMDTGKSWQDILANPEKKYEGTKGVAAFVAMCSDELFKASAWMTDTFLPPALDSIAAHPPPAQGLFPPQSPATRVPSPSPLSPSFSILGPAAPIAGVESPRRGSLPSEPDLMGGQGGGCIRSPLSETGLGEHFGMVGGAGLDLWTNIEPSGAPAHMTRNAGSRGRSPSPLAIPPTSVLAPPWSPPSPTVSRHAKRPSNKVSTGDYQPSSPIASRLNAMDYHCPASPVALRQHPRSFLPSSPVMSRHSHSRKPSDLRSPSPTRMLSPKQSFNSLSPKGSLSPRPSLTSLSLNFALGSPAPAPPPSVHLSNSPTHSPFNTAFRTEKEFFAWLEEKGNEGRMRRFGCAMTGSGGWEDLGGGGVLGESGAPW